VLWAVLITRFGLGLLPDGLQIVDGLHHALRAGFLVALFWSAGRGIDVLSAVVVGSSWATSRPTYRALVPLAGRVAKVLVVAVAMVALLSELGYPVVSLVAGLGLGGLAFALAAQKTVENLFGAFTLGADQPFREGDFVRLEDIVGTVEAIGLRSTRIRTLDRTLVTVPNGKLAEMRVESFAARDRIRLACTLGLVYQTNAGQLRQVLSGIERLLRNHTKIWGDNVVVRFSALGPSSLDIEVMAWFVTTDWGEFQGIRQDVLLGFMEVVEAAGTAFAYPTSTVHMVRQ
jgi:MscS family membrane protein